MSRRSVELVLVNQHYLPDVAATGQLLGDLVEHLAARGVRVRVLCARGRYVAGQVPAPAREESGGVEVRRLWTPGLGRRSTLGRSIDYAAFAGRSLLLLLFGRRPEGLVLLTTPPLLPLVGPLVRRLRGVPYAIWSMDLHPEAEVAAGLLRPSGRATRLLESLTGRAYAGAGAVVVPGGCMEARLRSRGVRAERIRRVAVWARADHIAPVPPEENPLAAGLGLPEGRFVVMYSGNAGLAHSFAPLLEAASRMRDDSGTLFLFAGDGPRRREIEEYAREHRLDRLVYRDYFERHELARGLSLGDVHFVSLRPEFAGVSVPAKLYGIMAASRPVLYLGPAECETGRTVVETGCGVVVDPATTAEPARRIVEVLRRWRADPGEREELGRRGREAFLDRYERRRCCEELELVLRAALSPAGEVRAAPS